MSFAIIGLAFGQVTFGKATGRCYVPDEKEEEAEPVRAIGDIARNHKELFFHLLASFFEAFDVSDPDEKVEDSKNASSE